MDTIELVRKLKIIHSKSLEIENNREIYKLINDLFEGIIRELDREKENIKLEINTMNEIIVAMYNVWNE